MNITEKPNGKFVVDWREQGKRKRKEFFTRLDAIKFRNQIRPHTITKTESISKLTKDFYEARCEHRPSAINEKLYFERLRSFCTLQNIDGLSQIDDQFILDLRKHLECLNLSQSTVRRHFALYKSFFNYAKKTGLLSQLPTDNMEPFRVRSRPKELWLDSELDALLKSLNDRVKRIVFFISQTAMAPKDVARLVWSNIDFESRFIRTYRYKGYGAEYNIPMSDSVYELLCEMRGEPGEFVFKNSKGKALYEKSLSSQISKKLKKLGIKKQLYGLRTTLITKLAFQGGVLVASKIAGHRSIKTTEAYYIKQNEGLMLEAIKRALPLLSQQTEGIRPPKQKEPTGHPADTSIKLDSSCANQIQIHEKID